VTIPTARGAVRWHPPRAVLDLLRLAAAGLLDPSLALARVPAEVLGRTGQGLVVEDAEGVPVAELAPDGIRSLAADGAQVSGHEVTGTLLVPVTGPLPAATVTDVRHRAEALGVPLTWLVLTGAGHAAAPRALVRATHDLAAEGERVVTLPVPLLGERTADAAVLRDLAGRLGAAALADVPPPGPGDTPHPAHVRAVPARSGVTVFFTGLSGSGKSTLARALAARLEDAGRTVTLLDGDEVRRLLSAGLGFSREDIATNIARIAFVAAEVNRHGGVAVCAPIAPFAAVRADARARVSASGAFVLVHVATPLAECERRDRKGLYARARAGEIPDFVGIHTPYEVPEDADLTIDTTGRNVDECLDDVWALLEQRGYGTRPVKDDDRWTYP
jgi:sulfate adenylyltransferase